MAALRGQGGGFFKLVCIFLKGASTTGMAQANQTLAPMLPATQAIWTMFVLCEEGAWVLTTTGKSLGFQLSFNPDVSTEEANKP